MNLFDKLAARFAAQRLTRKRIITAMTIAVIADLLQIVLFPVAWTFVQQVIDVVAMVLICWVIGFHILLLPTFVVELIPIWDVLPTWTGCVAAVIVLWKRAQRGSEPLPHVSTGVPGNPADAPQRKQLSDSGGPGV